MDAVNSLFLMLCTFLVLLMTPSLAMFYAGMVHSKNMLNTIMNCFIVFGVITLQWIFVGYSLSFSGDIGGGICGDFDAIFLSNLDTLGENGVPNILNAVFQMMFALIASAIITGSLVGRIKLGVLVVFLIFWSTFVYDILAHMIWGGGFLQMRGGLDFAGGGVVHVSSGVAGLVGALMVGARREVKPIQTDANSIPYSFLGAILLFTGWLGFNSGSAGKVDEIAVNAFIVTILSASAGYSVWLVLEWLKQRKPTLLGSLSGLVAGLVGITPGCGYVSVASAIMIGAISAVICFFGMSFVKSRLKLDDSLDAFSLHGIGGIWGGLCVGLFADSRVNPAVGELGSGLFIGGSAELLIEQIFSTLVCIALSAVASYAIFKIISLFTSLRVDERIENKGLDKFLHGEEAYSF